jgi:hypothetical protein
MLNINLNKKELLELEKANKIVIENHTIYVASLYRDELRKQFNHYLPYQGNYSINKNTWYSIDGLKLNIVVLKTQEYINNYYENLKELQEVKIFFNDYHRYHKKERKVFLNFYLALY